MDAILLQVLNGLDKGGAYALIALGLTLSFGTLGIVNFAHGEFLMLSMYAAFWLWSLFGLDPLFALPIAAALFFGLGIATVLTLVVTPAALAARIWLERIFGAGARTLWFGLTGLLRGGWSGSAHMRDRRLRRALLRRPLPEIIWTGAERPDRPRAARAAE